MRIGDSDPGPVSDVAIADAPSGRIVLGVVTDVDATLPDVDRLGAVIGGPTGMPSGQRVAHATDPDGNVLDLTTTTSGRAPVVSSR